MRQELAGSPSAEALQQFLLDRYSARDAVVVDSGTSALAMAFTVLRQALAVRGEGQQAVIAAPAFVCPDVLTAAQAAGVRLHLYDLNPDTLSPELSSLRSALTAGAHAVVAVHFFGYPFAVDDVRALCDAFGVPLIEDAAQSAGAMFGGRPAGAHGDLSVLSFGRGKGIGGGGGGALLINRSAPDQLTSAGLVRPGPASLGVRHAAMGAAQLLFEQRGWFALPSAIPGLHLGEAVYHAPQPVSGISRYGAALALASLSALTPAVAERAALAVQASDILAASNLRVIVPAGTAGWLRLCALLDAPSADRLYRFGVRRPYPRLLTSYPDHQFTIANVQEAQPGSAQLANELVTFPTHRGARRADYLAAMATLASAATRSPR
jgi:hypothetical protein